MGCSGLCGLQWVAVGCSGLQRVAAGCSGLQWVAVGCSGSQWVAMSSSELKGSHVPKYDDLSSLYSGM